MKYNVIVVGGGPAGVIAAATARKNYPEKSVAIIKKEPVGMIPCGIPYTFGTLGGTEKNILSTKGVENLGVQVIVDEVVNVDPEKKVVETKDSEYEYDKLILATGSEPVVPPISGIDLDGVFYISKYKDYLGKLHKKLQGVENVVVVGGGFIGVEVTDEIRKMGKKVTIIEIMDHLIPMAFDEEFGKMVQEVLESHGVKVMTSTKVERIEGSGKVEKVITDRGEVKAEVVILSTGYKPRVELAKKMGLKLGYSGAIATDEYMRTSIKDIFAVGDCVEHLCFFTGKPTKIMLASTATFDARIAGANLFKLKIIRKNHGTLAVFSTSIEGLSLASAGCNERMIKEEGFDVVIGEAKVPDRHPGSIPDASTITLKLVFSKESGYILGGQVAGGKSIGEIVNTIALAIQSRLTVTALATMQIGTHPLLTSAPTMYPIVIAAENALMKMRS